MPHLLNFLGFVIFSFSKACSFLACTSDKGTVHVFGCNERVRDPTQKDFGSGMSDSKKPGATTMERADQVSDEEEEEGFEDYELVEGGDKPGGGGGGTSDDAKKLDNARST